MTKDFQHPNSVDFSFVPVEMSVSIGRARLSIQDMLELKNGSVLKLDKRSNEHVEIFVGDTLVAYGEIEEENDPENENLSIKIVRLAPGAAAVGSPHEGAQ